MTSLSDVFWRACVKAVLVSLGLLIVFTQFDDAPLDSTQEAVVSASWDAPIDYRGDLNRWVVDGEIIPLDCPEEDSCTVQRLVSVVWIYRATS
jgi:hypothetical protein